jgi:hypothetical protein
MRQSEFLTSLGFSVAAAVMLVAYVLLGPDTAFAAEPVTTPKPQARPASLDRPALDDGDEIAVLDAIHITLSEVGDGNTYLWHRGNGRVSGTFRPTASFKDRAGHPCRHLVFTLTSGTYSRQTEGIACRLPGGRWQLTG